MHQKKSHWITFFLLAISFLMVGLGQPYLIPFFAVCASCIGFACFWKVLLDFQSTTKKFWVATLWFTLIQAIQLNWLTSDRYTGAYIFILYILLIFGIGLEFGLLSLFINKQSSLVRFLAVAGCWVIMEWSRLFIMTGFSWSSVGLALSTNAYAMQFASLGGLFGLSFWVILTNLFALRLFMQPHKVFSWAVFVVAATLPYLYGFIAVNEPPQSEERKLRALLVQTSLAPEEKVALSGYGAKALHPVEQWRRILALLEPYQQKPVDLIVLSEAVVPYGTDLPIYPQNVVADTFKAVYGRVDFDKKTLKQEKVGNRFWAHELANFFNADVIIGLEDVNDRDNASYNAAFLVQAAQTTSFRYEKRVLVPMGEYIPFKWCKAILEDYGIIDSFTPGTEAKVFLSNNIPVGISICYEETYGNLMRENRQKGAQLLVNITNDVWYPRSHLPLIHYYHGRLRAVENGVPLLRACNTGLTCAVDHRGTLLDYLEPETPANSSKPAVLYVTLPLSQHETVYSHLGDSLIVICSLLFISIGFWFNKL